MMGVQSGLIDSDNTVFWRIDIAVGYDCMMGWICANCGDKFREDQFDFKAPRYCPSCGLLVLVPNEDGDE